MSYIQDQLQYCPFKVGDNVVLSRAWKQGERGFTRLWNITHARWIGRKLQVIGVQPDGVSVQYVNGRESFLVPWFVLERFEEVPLPTKAAGIVSAGHEPVKVAQSQPMREFAGFWVDGAVRQPEQKHCDCTGFIMVMQKENGELIAQNWSKLAFWNQVYWLDTTTPTELTPQQAFELSQVIYPSLHKVFNAGDGFAGLEGNPLNSIVKWGDLSEYPQRRKWRAPTDEDKGRKCRYWDDGEDIHENGVFWCIKDDGRFIVENDENDLLAWDHCEVLDQ